MLTVTFGERLEMGLVSGAQPCDEGGMFSPLEMQGDSVPIAGGLTLLPM